MSSKSATLSSPAPDKTVLITGCSSGIGRETAEWFNDRGWHVCATARIVDDLQQLKENGCDTYQLDVTDPDEIENIIAQVLADNGQIDCLVNNAGYGQFGPVEEVPTTSLHKQFDVNVYGPHRLTRAVLPHMRERGSGTIINISSVAGRVALPSAGTYCASKHALEALSDALRPELEPYGIDVVVVEPGLVDTRFPQRITEEIDALEQTGAYDWFYRALSKFKSIDGWGKATPPKNVAQTIYQAATVNNPNPRYPVGTTASVGLLTRHVPAAIRDKIFRVLRSVLT